MLTRQMRASSRRVLQLCNAWTLHCLSTKSFVSEIHLTFLKSTSVMTWEAFPTQFVICTAADEQRWKNLPVRSRCQETIPSFTSSVICSLICSRVALIPEVEMSVLLQLFTVILADVTAADRPSQLQCQLFCVRNSVLRLQKLTVWYVLSGVSSG